MKLYNKSGRIFDTDDESKAYAKKVGDRYYVKSYRGEVYDPGGLYARYEHKAVLRQCSERCFDCYIKYLQTSKRTLYVHAGRAFLIND